MPTVARLIPEAEEPRQGIAAYLLRGLLVAVAGFGLTGPAFLALAPNRLLPGRPVDALASLGIGVIPILALAIVAVTLGRGRGAMRRLAVPCAIGAVFLLLVLTGQAAGELLVDRGPVARVMVGSGFWLALASLALLALDLARLDGRRVSVPATALVLLAGAGTLAWLGLLDALSLMVEYRARAGLLAAAFLRHLWLAALALALAFAIALPTAWAAFRSPRVESATGAVLGGLQVIPSLALFGFLVPLLALVLGAMPRLREFGFAAIGPTPAVIGVAAYLALPLVRGIVSGLKAADPAVVEAARAMGFSPARIGREILLPLGMPVFMGSLRLAAVQSIGLMTLGGLIGAGGLGAIVFEGMAQFAPDLILLAAAPIVLLAVGLDVLLAAIGRILERRGSARPSRRPA